MSKVTNLVPFAKQVLRVFTEGTGFDRFAKPLKIVEGNTHGRFLFKWKVEQGQLNAMGNLHGGCTAFLLDYTTTVSLLAMEKNTGQKAGVSVDMSVSYMNGAKEGEEVFVETSCPKIGKKIAFLEAVFRKEDGTIVATGKHTKYMS